MKSLKTPFTIGFVGILFLSSAIFFFQNHVSAEPVSNFNTLIPITYSQISSEPDGIKNTFEMGKRAVPLLLTNIILVGFLILHYKNNLPHIIVQFFNFIRNFEVSKRTTAIIILVLLGLYVIFSVPELSQSEIGPDVKGVKDAAESFSIKDFFNRTVEGYVTTGFRYLLLHISFIIFDNIRYVPLIVSISLLLVTFFLTLTLSKKRFSGIIAMIIILQSNLFLKYDTTATYENSWLLFYLLSLYLIYKKWYLSPISYVLSLFSKTLTAFFLPFTLFFIYRSDLARDLKYKIGFVYGIIFSLMVVTYFTNKLTAASPEVTFNFNLFWTGFTVLESFFRSDFLVSIFLLPVIYGLFILSKKGFLVADALMILIAGILFTAPLLVSLTDMTNQPYRFVPLVVFFAIGAGMLLSTKITIQKKQSRDKLISWIVFLTSVSIVLINLSVVVFPHIIQRQYALNL